ncbi:hypothetical protein C8A00DRAFT_36153 [Chaetomidium leptoderma]|uniref:RNA polymerase II assembly factor Rtp1 C-terminal domain-containing protein n=1 Tax=Chaetomidium leptoderma TaxID=669021 RepID=A0AAN6VGR4_9PEZI|nr:hypothetical protein C8A00DRAFT_36153 [Chaetomidium leptoderma]
MEQETRGKEKSGRQKLIESIIEAGSKAFNPDAPESSKASAVRDFDDLIERTKTLNVLGALNILVRPGATPPWLRTKLMEKLTLVPLRPDGVRATLEFVFSVHPSGTVKVSEAAVPQKRGGNITHEALTIASNLLSTRPTSVALSPEAWYSAISPQLLVLLDGGEGPELVKAASYIIGFGILGRRAAGTPGTAGWKFFAEPMLNLIKPPPGFSNEVSTESDGILDLSRAKVLVQHSDLVTALRRLHALVVSHPNPGLCRRLLSPLLLPLWALGSWPDAHPSVTEEVCTPALELLKIYLKLTPSPDLILLFAHNLGYIGGHDKSSPEWVYKVTGGGRQVQIVEAGQPFGNTVDSAPHVTFEDIDRRIPKLLDLATSTLSDADISTAFLELLKKWLNSARGIKGDGIVVKQEEEQDPFTQLTEIKTLQAMMEKFPEKLAPQPKHALDLVSQILSSSQDSPDDDDEVNGVALSLLNMFITAPGFRRSLVDPHILALIESSLDKLSKRPTSLSQTATNLRLLLLYRDEVEHSSTTTTAPTNRQIEDRKTYNLAITYITAADSPPPVRSEGLHLISTLITAHSPILDIPGILVLLSSLISDADEYIYLRIIKLYTLLATHHPRSVVRELTDHFTDAKETHTLDARLRFGEALAQVIQRLGETFTGPVVVAGDTATALLAVAGRRGYRPKTEARQAREARAQAKRNREAARAWGGEVPDFDSDDEDDELTGEEKRRNAVLERIVEGWEGKRGVEDVRVRASALSVLGTAVEVNVAGLGQAVVAAAVDLCVAVLQMEREVEKGILRRAAVWFVLSFVRALEEARGRGRELGLGFGTQAQEDVMRTLRYVAETDNDGLVVQHARDVVESLETWQVVKLLPAEGSRQPALGGGLTKLAGLAVDPERVAMLESDSRPRPRIEEVE